MISDAERAALLEDLRAQAKLRHHEKDRRVAAYLLSVLQRLRRLERDARIGQGALDLHRAVDAYGPLSDRVGAKALAVNALVEAALLEDDADA